MPRASGTEGFKLNQTILCVCDPQTSAAFYLNFLSMTLLQRIDMPDMSEMLLDALAEAQPSDPIFVIAVGA